jgi:hypothetical protein
MHGAVTEAFGGATIAAIMAKMDTFCEEGEMANLHKPGNCAHALGHTLMFVNGGDVGKSVDACLGFANEAMQYYCATGVYMEKIETNSTPATPLRSRYFPCDEEKLFPTACYRYKIVELLDRVGTPQRLARECLRLKGTQQLGCFHGLGHAVKDIVFSDPPQLAPLCNHGTQNDKIVCIEGVIEKLAEYDEAQAKIACSSLSGTLRPICEHAVTDKMYSLTKSTFALYYNKEAIAKRKNIMTNATGSAVKHGPSDYQH